MILWCFNDPISCGWLMRHRQISSSLDQTDCGCLRERPMAAIRKDWLCAHARVVKRTVDFIRRCLVGHEYHKVTRALFLERTFFVSDGNGFVALFDLVSNFFSLPSKAMTSLHIQCGHQSEIFFRNALLALGVRVSFFSNVASLVCKCDPGDFCIQESEAYCKTHRFKYEEFSHFSEHYIALFNAHRIKRFGWTRDEVGYRNIPHSSAIVSVYRKTKTWPSGLPIGNADEQAQLCPPWSLLQGGAMPKLDADYIFT